MQKAKEEGCYTPCVVARGVGEIHYGLAVMGCVASSDQKIIVVPRMSLRGAKGVLSPVKIYAK